MSDTPHPPASGLLVTVAVLLLASLTIMANATIAPSLPGLRDHFADVEGIDTLAGLLLTLPSAAIMLTAGGIGWLADRVNRQWLLVGAAAAVALGGASGLLAQTLPQMLVGRFVLGIGVAGTMTLALTWGADLWQGPARARYLGMQGATMSAGGVVVMLLGGALATLHWRGAFAAYLVVLPVAALAIYALAPHVRARSARGRVAAEAAEGRFPWRAFALVGPLAFLFMLIFYIMPTRGPFLLSDMGLTNPALIGAAMALLTLASIPGALLYGRLRRHVSAMAVFAGSYGFMGAGLLLVGLSSGLPGAMAGIVLTGIGMGPSLPNYSTYFMGFVPPGMRGRASGLLTTAFFAGQFASPLASAPLVAAFGPRGAFEAMGLTLIALCGVLGIVALRVRPAPRGLSQPGE
ncbi:MAG: MFS transporter [Gemmobacter sp.]